MKKGAKKVAKTEPAAGVHAVRSWSGRRGADKRWGGREDTVGIRAYKSDVDKLRGVGPTLADGVRAAVEALEREGGGEG